MSEEQEFKNRRRFQRVYFEKADPNAQKIPGVEAVWLNGQKVSVYDISYSGTAVGRPEGLELQLCHTYNLKFEFENLKSCELEAEVMWFNDSMVGMAFGGISGEARVTFNSFLSDKLIGANLVLVNPEFHGPNLDCTHWYQGPGETSVYIWVTQNGENKISKLQVTVGGEDPFQYENGNITMGQELLPRVIDLMSQMDDKKELIQPILKKLSSK